ncbi:unnamed protein product [Phytomonas sp. Hart1]|nr:unnamed protein product [Phytomonas sp. Hart1]|eukprot:CCW70092.1 unnamed protein product [Phytomonas sp. isolate Hart1]
MLRRIAVILPTLAASTARFYTPSEPLKKLYASDFEKAAFPIDITPSDSTLFAKFLYKAAEPDTSFETILKDLQGVADTTSKLPVFWERTCVLDDVEAFKNVSEPMLFTLHWMQSNDMLGLLPEVTSVYEAYVNAKLNQAVAKIYVAPGKTKETATIRRAKEVAEQLAKENSTLSGCKLIFKVLIDHAIVEGFAVDLRGVYVNQAKGRQVDTLAADEIDYAYIPPPPLKKTVWAENIETEVFRKYLDGIVQYDMEEVKYGV